MGHVLPYAPLYAFPREIQRESLSGSREDRNGLRNPIQSRADKHVVWADSDLASRCRRQRTEVGRPMSDVCK